MANREISSAQLWIIIALLEKDILSDISVFNIAN